MRLVELMVARNEGWILGFSLRAALAWADGAVVLNHASTDGTAEVLDEIQHQVGERLTILSEPDPEWRQFEYRQRILEAARDRGATHLAILDADEVLTANLLGEVRGWVEALGPGQYLTLPMRAMWGSPFHYRRGEFRFAGYNLSVAFRDSPKLGWWAENGYQHDHREPHGYSSYHQQESASGGVMHFQWAERRRTLAKHALYKMEHRLKWPAEWPPERLEAQYNASVDETGLSLVEAPLGWFAAYSGLMGEIVTDQPIWQEAECQRLWDEHGPGPFEGLTLWGFGG